MFLLTITLANISASELPQSIDISFNDHNLLITHGSNDILLTFNNLPFFADNLNLTIRFSDHSIALYDSSLVPVPRQCFTPQMLQIATLDPLPNAGLTTEFSLHFVRELTLLTKHTSTRAASISIFPILCKGIGIFYTNTFLLNDSTTTSHHFTTTLTSPDDPSILVTSSHLTQVILPRFSARALFGARSSSQKVNFFTFQFQTNSRSLFTATLHYGTPSSLSAPEYLATLTTKIGYNLICQNRLVRSRYNPVVNPSGVATLPVYYDVDFPSTDQLLSFKQNAVPAAEIFYTVFTNTSTSPPNISTTIWISTLHNNDTTTPFSNYAESINDHYDHIHLKDHSTAQQDIIDSTTTAYCTIPFQLSLPPFLRLCLGMSEDSNPHCVVIETQNLSTELLSFFNTPSALITSTSGDYVIPMDKYRIYPRPVPIFMSPTLVLIAPPHAILDLPSLPSFEVDPTPTLKNLVILNDRIPIKFAQHKPFPSFYSRIDQSYFSAFSPQPSQFLTAQAELQSALELDIRPSKWSFLKACGISNVPQNDDLQNDPIYANVGEDTMAYHTRVVRFNRALTGCTNAPRYFTSLQKQERQYWCRGYDAFSVRCPYDSSGKVPSGWSFEPIQFLSSNNRDCNDDHRNMKFYPNNTHHHPRTVYYDNKTKVHYASHQPQSRDIDDYIVTLSPVPPQSPQLDALSVLPPMPSSSREANTITIIFTLPPKFLATTAGHEISLVLEDMSNSGVFQVGRPVVITNLPHPSWEHQVVVNPTNHHPSLMIAINERNLSQHTEIYMISFEIPILPDITKILMILDCFFVTKNMMTNESSRYNSSYYIDSGIDSISSPSRITQGGFTLWPINSSKLEKTAEIYYPRIYRPFLGTHVGFYQVEPYVFPAVYLKVSLSASEILMGYLLLISLREAGLFYIPPYCTGHTNNMKFSTIVIPCSQLAFLSEENRMLCDIGLYIKDGTAIGANTITVECFFGPTVEYSNTNFPLSQAKNFTVYLYHTYTNTLAPIVTAASHGNTLHDMKHLAHYIMNETDGTVIDVMEYQDDDTDSFDPRFDWIQADDGDASNYEPMRVQSFENIIDNDDKTYPQLAQNGKTIGENNEKITQNDKFSIVSQQSIGGIFPSDFIVAPGRDYTTFFPPSTNSTYNDFVNFNLMGRSFSYLLQLDFNIYSDPILNKWIFNKYFGSSVPLTMRSYQHFILDFFSSVNRARSLANLPPLTASHGFVNDLLHALDPSPLNVGFVISYYNTMYSNPFDSAHTFRVTDTNSRLTRFSTGILRLGLELDTNIFDFNPNQTLSTTIGNVVVQMVELGYSLHVDQVSIRDMRVDPVPILANRTRTRLETADSDPYYYLSEFISRKSSDFFDQLGLTGVGDLQSYMYSENHATVFVLDSIYMDELLCRSGTSNDCLEGIPCRSDVNCGIGMYCAQTTEYQSVYNPLRKGICKMFDQTLDKTYFDPQEYTVRYRWLCFLTNNPYPIECSPICEPNTCGWCKTHFTHVSCFHDSTVLVDDSHCDLTLKPEKSYSIYHDCCGESILWGSRCNQFPVISNVNITRRVYQYPPQMSLKFGQPVSQMMPIDHDIFLPSQSHNDGLIHNFNANDTITINWSYQGGPETRVLVLLDLNNVYTIEFGQFPAAKQFASFSLNLTTPLLTFARLTVQILPRLTEEIDGPLISSSTQTFTILPPCNNMGEDLCKPYGICDSTTGTCTCKPVASGTFCTNFACDDLSCYAPGTISCSYDDIPSYQTTISTSNDFSQLSTKNLTVNAKCVCKSGWFGPTCGFSHQCMDLRGLLGCVNGNVRLDPNTSQCSMKCHCLGGWSGEKCDICDAHSHCNNHSFTEHTTEALTPIRGIPDAVCKSCHCMDGFAGSECQCRVVYLPMILLLTPVFLENYISLSMITDPEKLSNEDKVRKLRATNEFHAFSRDLAQNLAQTIDVAPETLFLYNIVPFMQFPIPHGTMKVIKDEQGRETNYYEFSPKPNDIPPKPKDIPPNPHEIPPKENNRRPKRVIHIPQTASVIIIGMYTNCHEKKSKTMWRSVINPPTSLFNPMPITDEFEAKFLTQQTIPLQHAYFRWKVFSNWANELITSNTRYSSYPAKFLPIELTKDSGQGLEFQHQSEFESLSELNSQLFHILDHISSMNYSFGSPIRQSNIDSLFQSRPITHFGGILQVLPLIDPNCQNKDAQNNDSLVLESDNGYILKCPAGQWAATLVTLHSIHYKNNSAAFSINLFVLIIVMVCQF